MVSFGDFDSGYLEVGDSRITLQTPKEVPPAKLSFEIEVKMDAEILVHVIERVFAFDIDIGILEIAAKNKTTNSTEVITTDEDNEAEEETGFDIGFFWDFDPTQEIEDDSVEQLKIIFFSISPTGLLLIKFNKHLIEPPILVNGRKLSALEERKTKFDISEVLEFDMRSSQLTDEEIRDKFIDSFTLESMIVD